MFTNATAGVIFSVFGTAALAESRLRLLGCEAEEVCRSDVDDDADNIAGELDIDGITFEVGGAMSENERLL